ncbi:protein of unknown function Spy-related protein [Gemmatirosa kalamazoonensis]|uniref:LTXXQ motif family protein n=1 Tax=Gemmatirosa kalamazoonensis TaxID=861299 RepID=W0RGB9_9BACT|nr:Spy/CpxP family protein refolding chaperone [Gemmatirosa kalamazoonensis]AHG89375.1 protein of unknown function Spy-related protein [Gemmatirosa kalamazoonensis]
MRKTISIGALALALVAAGVSAQPPRGDAAPRRDTADSTFRGRRGPGGPGGPERMLLKGITLTDAQRQQIAALHDRQRAEAARDEGRKAFDEVRAARQRGDTAAARAKMAELRTQMDRRREQQVASIRSLLTADQRTQFDANVAEMEKRQAQRGERGERGGR